MNKLILPQVPSGMFILDDKYKTENKRLIEVEAKDGKWQIRSDTNAKVVNPKYVNTLLAKKRNFVNSNDLYINEIVLQEYGVYKLAIGNQEKLYTLFCLPVYENNWVSQSALSTDLNCELKVSVSACNTVTRCN